MKTIRSFFQRLKKSRSLSRKLTRQQKGQTLVEYALIISLIVVVTIAVLIQMGTTLKGLYSTIGSQVNRANTGS
jgi:Flp pilus assembly pilin Flp